jgi:hypothetical protein
VAEVEDVVRTGVCLVRAELDPSAGLRLTVTVVSDVGRSPPMRTISTTVSIDIVLDQVRRFLTSFAVDAE